MKEDREMGKIKPPEDIPYEIWEQTLEGAIYKLSIALEGLGKEIKKSLGG